MSEQASVLVVDDDPLVLGLLHETLAPHFAVTTATSGNDALAKLRTQEFEVLLADQRMPGMTGVALAARARELCPHIVTVLLSAYADPKDFIAAINHGQVFRFVSKPWDHNDLVLTLQHAAERYRLGRDNAQLIADRERRLRALELLQAVVAAGARGEEVYPARELLARLREVFCFDLAAVLTMSEGACPLLDLTSTRPVNEKNVLELRDAAVELFVTARGKSIDEARLCPTSSCQVAAVDYAAVQTAAHVTLTSERLPTGILLLQSFTADAFPPDSARLLDLLANGAAEVLQDIRAARTSEWRRLTQALAVLDDGLVVLGASGEVQLINAAAHELLAAAGATIESLWQVLGSSPAHLLAGKSSRTREVPLGTRTLQARTTPMTGDDLGVVLTLRDITAEKERDARRLRFVSTVSHEIRTPLSAIVATFDLLLHDLAGEVPPKQREYLVGASSACDTLNAVVDDLIDIEKYAAGGMTLVRRKLVLAELARASAARFGAAAAENQVTIDTRGLGDEITVEADSVRLDQVLGNLLSNAIKFASRGTTITLELGTSRAPEGWVVLAVHNAGPDLSSRELETIFDRFATAVSGSSRRHASGLGLPISRTIIEAHGGVIAVESHDGRTSFFVALPTVTQRPTGATVELPAPLLVHAKDRFDRIGLFATLARTGLPVRLLPPSHDGSPAHGGLVLVNDASGAGDTELFAGKTRAEVQSLGETMVLIARHTAARLLLKSPPTAKLERLLLALGINVAIDPTSLEARALSCGDIVSQLDALAIELSGEASAVGAVRAFLRRARDAGVGAALVLRPERFAELIKIYGAAHMSSLRDNLLREVLAAMGGGEGASARIFSASAGFICVGEEEELRRAAKELELRFATLVRLYCKREDRERGYLQLSSERVPLPTLTARVLDAKAADDEIMAALGMSP